MPDRPNQFVTDPDTSQRDLRIQEMREYIQSITLKTETPLNPEHIGDSQFDNWFIVRWRQACMVNNYERAFYLACAFERFVNTSGWFPRHRNPRAAAALAIMQEVHGRIL